MLIRYYFRRIWVLIPYILLILLNPMINTRSSIRSAQMMDCASSGDYNGFVHSLIIVLIFFVVHGVFLFISHVLRTRLIRNARESLREDMFESTISSVSDVYKDPDTGFLIAAFSNDITILEYKYFDSWLIILESIVQIIIAGTAIFSLNRVLALVIFIGEIFSVLICLFVRTYSIRKNKIFIEKLALFTQRIKDYFSSFQTIHNYCAQKQIQKKFSQLNTETEHSKDEADMALTFVNTLAKICNSILKFVVTGFGVVLMMNGEITIGLIYAAYQFCNQIISPMQSMIGAVNAIESVRSITQRTARMFRNNRAENTAHLDKTEDEKGIDIKDVTVAVDGNVILDHFSHTFEQGKKYLIIGKNGAGKSTLLRLLKKSTLDYRGEIRVDGVNLLELTRKELSTKISYINESVSLLCDTVKQNILLFREVSDERFAEIVRMVGLSVEPERVIKDGERNLSSGETRRIEIARSLVNSPEVIIYDEAISTLDVQTAYAIEKMLLNLPEQTVIFVSHNFSGLLIKEYDEIVLMEDGQVIASGTHDELLERSAYYRNIMTIKNGENYG